MVTVQVATLQRRTVEGRWIAPTDERAEAVVRVALLDRIEVGDPAVTILPTTRSVQVDQSGTWRADLPVSPASWRLTVGGDERDFTVPAGTTTLHI